jgi:chromosome segregation ATPase
MLAARKEEVSPVDVDSEKIEERFDKVDGKLDRFEERFDHVDRRLDKVDARLDKIEGRLDNVDRRFDKVDARLDKCEERLGGIEVRVAVLTTQCGQLIVNMTELKGDVKGLSKEIGSAKIWALLIVAGALGVMARGFHWI